MTEYIKIAGNRTNFTLDEFVKRNEIRMVVNEALQSLISTMAKNEVQGRNNRKEIAMLETKFQNFENQLKSFKRIEISQRRFMTHIAEHNKKIAEGANF